MTTTMNKTELQTEIDRLHAYRAELRKVMIGIRNPAAQSYVDRHDEIDRITLRLGLLYNRLED